VDAWGARRGPAVRRCARHKPLPLPVVVGVNPNLSPAEGVACLEILYQGLLLIRSAGWTGDAARAAAIADALHNVPHLLTLGQAPGWTVETFRDLYLEPLIERYPDLAGLAQPLDALR
jgi:hypothetical protein